MDTTRAKSVGALEQAVDHTPAMSFVEPEETSVFGCRIHAIDEPTMFGMIETSINDNERLIVASQNMHGVHTHLTDPAFRLLHDSPETKVHIDGTPVLWLAKAKGDNIGYEHRTGCIDWVPELFALAAQRTWRIYHLGSTDDALDAGFAEIRNTYPDLLIEGRNGFFNADPSSQENREVVEKINAADPDILLVGMGMGRQEQWILQNKERLNAPVILTTGAMIKLLAGELNMAPRWLGPLGLEWVFRLYDNFGETAQRYLVEPFHILWNSAKRHRAQSAPTFGPTASRLPELRPEQELPAIPITEAS